MSVQSQSTVIEDLGTMQGATVVNHPFVSLVKSSNNEVAVFVMIPVPHHHNCLTPVYSNEGEGGTVLFQIQQQSATASHTRFFQVGTVAIGAVGPTIEVRTDGGINHTVQVLPEGRDDTQVDDGPEAHWSTPFVRVIRDLAVLHVAVLVPSGYTIEHGRTKSKQYTYNLVASPSTAAGSTFLFRDQIDVSEFRDPTQLLIEALVNGKKKKVLVDVISGNVGTGELPV